ncbi:MAG: hypothetical protein IK066_06920 [Kiritimatiellae bacterium]|nr:hypothetical protein [Kiritimatiellia bacterium]
MKARTTHSPFFPTLVRYAQALREDVSFTLSAKMLLRILVLAAGIFLLIGALGGRWAEVYGESGGQDWKQYLFGLLGAIDAKPEAGSLSVLYSAFVRLVGAVVIGGVITSFLCALAERLADMKLRGLLVPVLRDHFVVVGHGAMTDDLIRALLAPQEGADLAHWVPQGRSEPADRARDVASRKVLLCTGGDVESIRETLDAVLPPSLAGRVLYAFGDMNLGNPASRDAICRRLCLQDARQIYVLGDEKASTAGDVENLAFARGVGAYLAAHAPKHPDGLPKPVFVRLDAGASFDLVKKISFETEPAAGQAPRDAASWFKPFSFTEGWARRMWGDAAGEAGGALDFAPMGPETRVHLVVAGFTPMGEALVLEALRTCHFPNGRPTRITVVDPSPEAEESFLARHPWLKETLADASVEFLARRIESAEARDLMRKSALDENVLLTVAVCFRHTDSALSAALNLPEEVYWHRLPAAKRTVRDRYREHGARIWVAQEHRNGLAEGAEGQARYGNLRPFGMQEGGFEPRCLREFSAAHLNAVYDWPNEPDGGSWLDGCTAAAVKDRIAAFRTKWAEQLSPDNPWGVFEIDAREKKDLLLAILAAGKDAEVRRFQEYAFRKYVALKPALRWANVYVADSYGAVFRALGLRAVAGDSRPAGALAEANDRVFSAARAAARLQRGLDETEHNRWIADRALMGYRAPRPDSGEKRDDDFRYHFDLVPFSELPPNETGKDELSICCIPLFMALEGVRLERMEDNA